MLERAVMKNVRLWCGQHDIVCFRVNVGKVRVLRDDGTLDWFDTGLPKGFPDLLALGHNGRSYFIETKKPKNAYQRKEQKDFQAMAEARGFIYILARSEEDVAKIILKEENIND